MSKHNPKTLVVLSKLRPAAQSDDKLATVANLDHLVDKANQQYAAIKAGDQAGSMRGLCLGLLFWQIKNECGHGSFMKVASERMSQIPQRTRQDYMKLATVFIERSRVAFPERFNIPDAQLALNLGDAVGTEAEFVKKAVKFIGELSLHDLMIKYDIRAVGLKKEIEDKKKNEEPLPPKTPEDLYLQYRDEAGLALDKIESLFLREGCLSHLIGHPEELKGIASTLSKLAAKIESQVQELLDQPAPKPVELVTIV